MRQRWQAMLDHPILRLELRRTRRTRWWPGRRFFWAYSALLGCGLGYGVALLLTDSLVTQVSISVTAVPIVCLSSAASALLSTLVVWIAPALSAATIVRERELGTLDLLRTTLLTERAIVLGKLGGCLVRLWPGILALLLLSPFQLVLTAGGGLMTSPGLAGVLSMGLAASDGGWPWGWLVLAGLVGLLRPWASLAFHGAVGAFVSVLARSTGAAIAVSYGAVLVARAGLWVLTLILGSLPLMTLGASSDPAMQTGRAATLMVLASVLPGLVGVCIQVAGAFGLVWAATWWLKRT